MSVPVQTCLVGLFSLHELQYDLAATRLYIAVLSFRRLVVRRGSWICPLTFSLVVDDFGIKYKGEEHFDHLLDVIREEYQVEIDETGGLYCGIKLEWNYKKGHVDISMPGYVHKQLTKYGHTLHQKNHPLRPRPCVVQKMSPRPSPPLTQANPLMKKVRNVCNKHGHFFVLWSCRGRDHPCCPQQNCRPTKQTYHQDNGMR